MNGQHVDAKMGRGFDCSSDRVGDIVELEIEPNFGAGGQNGAHNSRAFGRVKLQPDFEERNLGAQLLHQVERFFFCRNVQRDDDFISGVCHYERTRGISRCL